MEQWKKVLGYDFIEISNYGRMRTLAHTIIRKDGKPFSVKGTVLSPFVTKCGYIEYSVRINGKNIHFSAHREVAKAFVANVNNKTDVNHKDGNKQNNIFTNLEWVSKTENMQHAIQNNLWHPEQRKEEKHPLHKLTRKDVVLIRQLLNSGKYTQHSIAVMFGVCDERICRIKQNKVWKDIK